MCWNYQVSIITFMLVITVCSMLYRRDLPNDKLFAFFILSYGTMQLFEAMMWIGQKNEYKWLNHFGTIMAFLLLLVHPLALSIGITIDKNYKDINKNLLIFIYAISILVIMYGLYVMKNDKHNYMSYPHPYNHHLVWDFDNLYPTIIMPIAILIGILVIRPFGILALILTYFIGAIIISYYILDSGSSNGSFWCWIVAAFAIIVYAINSLIENENQ